MFLLTCKVNILRLNWTILPSPPLSFSLSLSLLFLWNEASSVLVLKEETRYKFLNNIMLWTKIKKSSL